MTKTVTRNTWLSLDTPRAGAPMGVVDGAWVAAGPRLVTGARFVQLADQLNWLAQSTWP